MQDIIVKLRSIIGTLPDSERKVADYALRNPDRFPFLSIYEVAKKVGVSAATVTRLTKKLGVKNLKEVKIKFAQNMETALTAVFEGIDRNDTRDTIVKKIFGGNIHSLEDTIKILDFEALGKTSEAILRCSQVIFTGIGSSSYIAQDASLRFLHLGIPSIALKDPFESAIHSFVIPKTSVCIGISHSGRTKSTIGVMTAARKAGAVTAAISNYPESPLAKACDYFLCTAFRETWTRASAVSSRISQICIIDALNVLVAKELHKSKTMERINDIVESEFRTK